MKKTSTLLSIIVLFLLIHDPAYGQLSDSKSVPRSMAIILKVSGGSSRISKMEIFSFHLYNGTAKNTQEIMPVKTSDILKIKVSDDINKIIYEGYYENPLNQNLESFEEDGTINNNILPDNTGYINMRFPVPGNVQNMTINCYAVKNDNKENLVSTIKYKVQ